MKIAYISNSTIPSVAANSIHVMKMCQAFSYNGHSINLIAKQGGAIDWGIIKSQYGIHSDFSCHQIQLSSFRGKGYLYAWKSVHKAIAYNPNVVYSRNLIAAWIAAMRGQKVVFESHSPVCSSGLIANALFKMLIKSSNFISLVVITKTLSDYYVENYSICNDLIIIAADGADPISQSVTPVKVSQRAKAIQVGYVGHLYPGKGMEVILPLAKLNDNVDFHVVGGTDYDLNFWREKSKEITNIYFHGYVEHQKVTAYIDKFDIVLLPNQEVVGTHSNKKVNIGEWTSPLKAFEYMSAGKPIISSDLRVLKEIFEHEKTALFAISNDPYDWSSKLKLLVESPDLRVELGNSAKKMFLNEYTWQKRANKIITFLRSSLNK